eukprot:8854805-Pyramimonas_sp.AAC.1
MRSWTCWEVAPGEVEIAVRRLGMYKGWAKGPANNGQVLRSLFGEMRAGANRRQLVSGRQSAFSSPSVKQVHFDVAWASSALDEEFFLHRDLRLLGNKEWSETFVLYDFSVLGAREFSVAIPLPAQSCHSAETSLGQ